MTGKPGRVRVLLFDHTAELGGGELALAELVKRIDPDRVDLTVLLGSHGPLEDLIRDHVLVQFLLMSSRVRGMARSSVGLAHIEGIRAIGQSLSYVWRLTKLMRAQQFDIIHTNSLKAGLLGGLAGRLAGCRVVWHIRDRIAPDYLPRRAVRLVRMAARVLPHRVIANSRATLQTLHLKRKPYEVIYSGVDIKKFSSGPASEVDGPKQIGLVGRICPWKGQHIFIEAAQKVHAVEPNTSFQIVGAALYGETEYETECRELVRRYNLEQVLEFKGFSDSVALVMNSLDLIVHASVLGEPFGQVIVQGMAMGKPVIATNGGGVPEIIDHGKTGLLVKMGDADEMASAMVFLLRDPKGARRLGENGRRRVEECFSVDDSARKVMRLWEAER